MLLPGYEEGTSNFVQAVGSAEASGHEAAPAAAIDTLSQTGTLAAAAARARCVGECCARGVGLPQADICQLGMDQRKVNMLAREYCDAIKRKNKPIILSHRMRLPCCSLGEEDIGVAGGKRVR